MSNGHNAQARKGLETEKVNRRHMHARRKNKKDSWEAKHRGSKRQYAREYHEMEEDDARDD